MILLNAKLRNLCRKIHAKSIDLGEDIDFTDGIEKDRLHYGGQSIRLVSHYMAEVLNCFFTKSNRTMGSEMEIQRKQEQEIHETYSQS